MPHFESESLWNSEMANCVITERVERVVVLNKLYFEWQTGTENHNYSSQKQQKTRKRSRIVCHHLRKAGLPGLQGSKENPLAKIGE